MTQEACSGRRQNLAFLSAGKAAPRLPEQASAILLITIIPILSDTPTFDKAFLLTSLEELSSQFQGGISTMAVIPATWDLYDLLHAVVTVIIRIFMITN